jgi:hypothetical protein
MKKYLLGFLFVLLFVPFLNVQASNVCAGKTWKACPTGKTFMCISNKPTCVIMTAVEEEATAPQLYVFGSVDAQIQQIVVFLNKLSKAVFDLQKGKTTSSNSNTSSNSSSAKASNTKDINLSAGSSTGEVEWDIDSKSNDGYMLIWSKNSGPTYPKRSGDYYKFFSSPSATSGKIGTSGGSGSFYVRLCALNEDTECSVYSNEIKVTAPDPED